MSPPAATSSDSASSSAQVVGIDQPLSANVLGEYQTNYFTLAPSGGA